MGETDKELEQKKAHDQAAADFFNPPSTPIQRGAFGDGKEANPAEKTSNLAAPAGDALQTIDGLSKTAGSPDSTAESPVDTLGAPDATASAPESPGAGDMQTKTGPAAASPPLTLPGIIFIYLDITRKLIMSPMSFFKHMEKSGGLKQPATYLGVSALGNALFSFLLAGFNFGQVPRNFIFVLVSGFVASGLSYMMAKGMGSKCSFEVVFRVFAYCSCLSLASSIPGMGFITPIAALFLYFVGLREVLGVSLYQTCTIMFLICFLQVIMMLGH